MGTVQLVAIVATVISLWAIYKEHAYGVEKTATAATLFGVLWALVIMTVPDFLHHFEKAGVEALSVVIFLLSAMAQVERLNHYHLFDRLRTGMLRMHLGDTIETVIIWVIVAVGSMFLDNLTMALVGVTIALRFFTGNNLLVVACGIVGMANVLAAASPIGDITTYILWQENKFAWYDVIIIGFPPALAHCVVFGGLLLPLIQGSTRDLVEEDPPAMHWSDWVIIAYTVLSFLFPVVAFAVFDAPPFSGLVVGVGTSQLLTRLFGKYTNHETHLESDITKFIREGDTDTVYFLFCMLMNVGALSALGVLGELSAMFQSLFPAEWLAFGTSTMMGYLSAGVDNVPLAATMLEVLRSTNVADWVYAAYTLGTGGSHLLVGSAAGLVVMGAIAIANRNAVEEGNGELVPVLTSEIFFKMATWRVAVAYLAGAGVFLLLN